MGYGWEMRTKRSLLFPQADLLLHPWPSPSYLIGGEGPWQPGGISHAFSVPANLAHPLIAPRQERNIPQFCFTSLPHTHVTALSFHFLVFLRSPAYDWSRHLKFPDHFSWSGHSLLWAALGPDFGLSENLLLLPHPHTQPRPLCKDLSLEVCSQGWGCTCSQVYSIGLWVPELRKPRRIWEHRLRPPHQGRLHEGGFYLNIKE